MLAVDQRSDLHGLCRPGGRVAIFDIVVAEPELAEDYNHRERLRDPSHTRALTAEELRATMEGAGLEIGHFVERDQPLPLERWLAQTQPPDEVAAQLRAELEGELSGGPATQHRDGELHFTQRWAIAVGRPHAA